MTLSWARPKSDLEQLLTDLLLTYTANDDGTYEAFGNINLTNRGLEKLPDLSRVLLRGDFRCSRNKLTDLVGAPLIVGGIFACADNMLTSLQGAPEHVGGDLYCSDNRLTSLQGAPRYIGNVFDCERNPDLKLLGGAPAEFATMITDLGVFASPNAIPPALRLTPEEKALAVEQALADATVLQSPLAVRSPLKLRLRAP